MSNTVRRGEQTGVRPVFNVYIKVAADNDWTAVSDESFQ